MKGLEIKTKSGDLMVLLIYLVMLIEESLDARLIDLTSSLFRNVRSDYPYLNYLNKTINK